MAITLSSATVNFSDEVVAAQMNTYLAGWGKERMRIEVGMRRGHTIRPQCVQCNCHHCRLCSPAQFGSAYATHYRSTCSAARVPCIHSWYWWGRSDNSMPEVGTQWKIASFPWKGGRRSWNCTCFLRPSFILRTCSVVSAPHPIMVRRGEAACLVRCVLHFSNVRTSSIK